ncbi:GNAT family N-acetyltransferase [Nakamurella leprariae]|uniref:GNAT family N-acetyltransferase n=1 Tax=Nakamurella leprariae TaxID=2803911 RepID=A0A938YJX0_9ACTN|nr:GNAT family N-acetyltransferase [Nakamurella leprariae]MBM9469233.1 GNAT family N-acetyltransferase [Nakamurella leprariae]
MRHARAEPGPGQDDAAGTRVRLVRWTAEQFRARVQELVDVYVQAMGYPPGVATARSALWDEHSRRPDFDCWVALDAADRVRGLCYGYRGLPGQWWYSEVRRGVERDASRRLDWLADFFELTELHVRPDTQGSGLGEALLRRLLDARTERRVLLSTPEGENRAWRLYRRLGFEDLLRHYRFSGDARPFGILGRDLPLPEVLADRHADHPVG